MAGRVVPVILGYWGCEVGRRWERPCGSLRAQASGIFLPRFWSVPVAKVETQTWAPLKASLEGQILEILTFTPRVGLKDPWFKLRIPRPQVS